MLARFKALLDSLGFRVKKRNGFVHLKQDNMQLNYTLSEKPSKPKQNRKIELAPPAILSLCILGLVVLGAVILKLPVSTTTPISWIESFFTATSAVTVTGLGVVDTGTRFTIFGQTVIAILIQFGGLGLMTFAVVTIIALGGRLGFLNRTVAKEAFNQTDSDTIFSTAKAVIIFSLSVELIGFSALSIYWAGEYGISKGLFHAFFYTISAYNNAGFALSADNLIQFVADPMVTLTISVLIIVGGLGFSVWIDILRKRTWQKLTVYSRMMILGTLGLNLGAFILIYLLEYNNPNTFVKLTESGKWLASWFQAVSPRTAGFNTLDYSQVEDSTTVLTLLLMFIGGGSLSTASGIKVVTFMLLILASYSYIRRREQISIFNREIAPSSIHKAFSLTILSMAIAWLAIFILTLSEDAPFLDITFEVISALGTVGLSRGLTANLSDFGLIIIMFVMMIGRLGPLTFIYFFARPQHKKLRYVEIKMPIG
ncbi:TrkH family potassium uptake protein [Thorsellia anophelis]|uniref:Trk system potassium uptake protein TrkH n=1 Tax=Thorsellia anophelis DSM 18579 TaxID=1123402 RepID=A0A1I0AB08_9GAMM|nr:TrkH family potassium uptake protein [Thorsellia anophelis]SES91370.1 trk system potassium uptake protein TrkH [Thorsellia anophelis DSM 18579]